MLRCGGCGRACVVANGSARCAAGQCQLAGCDAGYDDCNAVYQDGCETRLATVTNCGVCGKACSNPNGSTACVNGACAPLRPRLGDCDGSPDNGCETHLATSTERLGVLGQLGFGEELRAEWLVSLRASQQPDGCFPADEAVRCHPHPTALALWTLAHASRAAR